MSPLTTGALATAIFLGAATFITCVMDVVAGQNLVHPGLEALGGLATIVAFIAFFVSLARESILVRIRNLEDRLRKDIVGYGELCTEDGRRDAIREYARGLPIQSRPGLNLVSAD